MKNALLVKMASSSSVREYFSFPNQTRFRAVVYITKLRLTIVLRERSMKFDYLKPILIFEIFSLAKQMLKCN